MACRIEWACSGPDKSKLGPVGWRSPTGQSRASMRLWLDANRLFRLLAHVCCDIPEGGSQVGMRSYLSLNNIVEKWICFLVPAEGHLPLPLLCLFTSPGSWSFTACLVQRRGLPLCLLKFIAQTKGGPSQEQGRAQGSVTNSTKPLHNSHFGNVTPSLALLEDSQGCRTVSAAQGVISRHTLNCYVGH